MMPITSAQQTDLDEIAVKKERESFKKRKAGLVKKTEQLRRVWPLCDIEQKIIDRVTGDWYIYKSTEEDFPSVSQLRESPEKIIELLGPNDFEEVEDDDEDRDRDADGDGSLEDRIPRRKMQKIRQRKGKKGTRAQSAFQVKNALSQDTQKQIGTRRRIRAQTKPRQEFEPENFKSWEMPPLPILKLHSEFWQ